MVKRGEKFPEEDVKHSEESPGVVDDGETLERRLPPKHREILGGAIPREAFSRRELQWTEEEGGASVIRRQFAQIENAGQRGERTTISATVGDIRNLTDKDGNRLWSVIDRPTLENPAHAEIQREPLGAMPGRLERDRFLEAWHGAGALLESLRNKDPHGKPELKFVPGTGVEIHWRSGDDGSLARIIQVESVFEAVRAYIAAGIVPKEKGPEELCRLKRCLESNLPCSQNPGSGAKPTWF